MELIKNENLGLNFGYEVLENGNIMFSTHDIVLALWSPEIKNGKSYPQWAKAQRIVDSIEDSAISQKIKDTHLISEEILYSLIMKSNSPIAIKFQVWLATDVLPSIRKYGCYITENADEEVVKEVLNAKTIGKQLITLNEKGYDVSRMKKLIEENTPKGKGSSELQKIFTDNAVRALTKMSLEESMTMGKKGDVLALANELKQNSIAIYNRAMGRKIEALEKKVEKVSPAELTYSVKISPFSENKRNVKLACGKIVNSNDFREWKTALLEELSEMDIRYNGEQNFSICVRLSKDYVDISDVDNFTKPFQDVLAEYLGIDDSIIRECHIIKEPSTYKLGYRFGFK